MSTLAEKRVFTERADTTRVLVASSLGVVGVSVSGDLVGEFGVDHRCTARDVAAGGGALAVATDEDVLVGDFRPTGHGPAVAVSLDRRGTTDATDSDAAGAATVLAAAPDGTVSRLDPSDGSGDGEEATDPEWTALGRVDDPRRMDGPLVAAADGVHRVVADRVEYAGLDAARDVAAGGVPLAATDEGLYALGNGWLRERESDGDGGFRAVAADAAGGRALAATAGAVYERADATAEWVRHDESDLADVAVAGDLRVGVTGDGELRVDRDGEWRGRALGLPDVAAVAVPTNAGGTAEGADDASGESVDVDGESADAGGSGDADAADDDTDAADGPPGEPPSSE